MTPTRLLAVALAAGVALGTAQAQTLRIGLAEDPDVLDPTMARTFVGRIVFAGLCDKLFDIDDKLTVVPQLATAFEWSGDAKTLLLKVRPGVKFHDGEPMDAEAVRFSLDRHLTAQGSFRRVEISVVQSVEAVDAGTVKLTLSAPFSPLIAALTDRAGMIMSPKAVKELGAQFGTKPVCAGPFKFVERVAQDRIVGERFADYWDKGRIHVDRVVWQPIPDSTVRLANLQAGSLELVERLQPTDAPAVQRNNRLVLTGGGSLGYQAIYFNVASGERAKGPLGNAKVRAAFDAAIDRATINQVVYEGQHIPTAQAVPPASPFHIASIKVPTRDVARAKQLLQEAGQPNPTIELMVATNPDLKQVAEIVQAMTREAGFTVNIRATEFATSLNEAERGNFDAFVLGWSGRPDPDGNLYSFVTTKGPLNYSRWSNAEVDKLMDEARAVSDIAARRAVYEKAAAISGNERPMIYLWHPRNLVGHTAKLTGFKPVPDGLIRLQDVKLAN